MSKKKKIYAFVDESGQDTMGELFVVSVLVEENEIWQAEKDLLGIESRCGKKLKWRKSKHSERVLYFELIAQCRPLTGKIYYDIFSDTKKYIEMASYAAAKAILKKVKGDYRATVFVDGLKRGEMPVFIRGLRDLKIRTKKIRGVKKDETSAFIRLVDAVCGLVRDAEDGRIWARDALKELHSRKIIERM